MASKKVVVYLTGSIAFFVRKGGEKTSHCVKCISRTRHALMKCDVIRLLIAYQNSSGFFIHSPFYPYICLKRHIWYIVFRSQMIIDMMIVNRLKHRVLDDEIRPVMFHLPNIFRALITNGNCDQQQMSYNTQYLVLLKYKNYTHELICDQTLYINSTASGDVSLCTFFIF